MLRILIFSTSLLFLTYCKKDSGTPANPLFTVDASVSVSEDIPSGNATINIYTTNSVGKPVTIIYSTSDSTAIAGKDYQAANHVQKQISAGTFYSALSIPIYSDTSQKQDLVFKVHIDSVINGIVSIRDIRVSITNTDYAKLVWSDEFDGNTVNSDNWNFELGNNGGWEIVNLRFTQIHLQAYQTGNLLFRLQIQGEITIQPE